MTLNPNRNHWNWSLHHLLTLGEFMIVLLVTNLIQKIMIHVRYLFTFLIIQSYILIWLNIYCINTINTINTIISWLKFLILEKGSSSVILYFLKFQVNAHRKPWAMETCGIIKNGPVFSKCRSVLPNIVVNNYYDDCLFDACG